MTKFDPSTIGLEAPDVLNPDIKTLVIGDIARWVNNGHHLPDVDGLVFVALGDLTGQLLRDFDPDLVLSPLMQADCDATDIAQRLSELGFRGRYRAVCDELPNIEMVAHDVQSQAPDIDFDLVSLPVAPFNGRSRP